MTLMFQILRFLEDGAWHRLSEIGRKVRVPTDELRDHCAVLSGLGLIEYEEGSSRIRMGRELRSMISALATYNLGERKWGRMGAGTVIVPPFKQFKIQGVSMQNMTGQDLKIEFTFNVKPVEIVISEA